MKKILYIENVASINAINFYKSAAIAARNCGLEFHLAYNANDRTEEKIKDLEDTYGVHFHQIDFIRTPYNPKNIKAYKQVCKLINELSIDYIHCNTPIGGVIGRLAGSKYKVKKVIYQAHGFHFYTGAPIKNWLIYYPIEKWLAHKTDALITINKEDYQRAEHKFKLRNNGKVYYVPGVGIDLSNFNLSNQIRIQKRKELRVDEKDVALISAGELNENKNNKVVIEAISKIKNKNVHYFLCGIGPCEKELKDLANRLGIERQIHFLGYRNDVKELYQGADLFVMPSYREGLSRSIMEAMASGLPCIVSKIRGNIDLINDFGGYTCNPNRSIEFSEALDSLINDSEKRISMGKYNQNKICDFSIDKVSLLIKNIYENELVLR